MDDTAAQPTVATHELNDRPSTPLTLIVAVVASVVAVTLTQLLHPMVPQLTWLLALAAVAISAWRGGAPAGLLATVLGGAGILWFRLEPTGSLRIDSLQDLLWMSSYVFVALLVTIIFWAQHRERRLILKASDDYRGFAEQLQKHVVELEREVAQRRRHEEVLERQADLLDLTYDAIVVWETRPAGRITYWNRGASVLYGFAADDAAGECIHDLLGSRPLSERLGTMTDVMSILLRDGHWEGDLVQQARDGRRIVIESRMVIVRPRGTFGELPKPGEPAPPASVLETSRDVTARHEMEEAQRASEAYHRLLAEAGRALAGSLDFQSTLRAVAQLAVPTLADYCIVDLLTDDGQLRRVASAHVDAAMEPLLTRMIRHFPEHIESDHPLRLAMQDGETRLYTQLDDEWRKRVARNPEHLAELRELAPVSMVLVPLIARGNTLGILSVAFAHPSARGSGREYTQAEASLVEELARRAAIAVENARLYTAERAARAGAEAHANELNAQAVQLEHQSEQARTLAAELEVTSDELRAAMSAAEAASRAKSDFLATISHEIRTPINAMLGYNELLELGIPGPVTEQQRVYLERVRSSGRHLLALVDEILDLSRVEAGTMGLLVHQGVLAKPVQAALDLVRSDASAREVDVDVTCAGQVEYEGDEDRVRQIVVNLLSNAIKFSDPGGRVRVSCGVREVLGGLQRVFVEVADTGIGIPEDELPRIFEPFVQLETGFTRRHGGSGLGLSISLRLARLMAGDLTVHSQVGKGSVFTLWLPVPVPQSEQGRAPGAA
jgi:signal transduction histidine kinase/PAS domain-containing protein